MAETEKSPDTESFSGNETIKLALQLIRYDIPILILGKSSIGKSYTIDKITEKWHISNQLLYVGSEKSENIEGVPKFTDRKEGKEILEYLQPYWFPNAMVITKSVSNGREVFEHFTKNFWGIKKEKGFKATYANLMSMLNALENVSWSSKDLVKGKDVYKQSVMLVDYEWIDHTGGSSEEGRSLNESKGAFTFEKHGVPTREEGGVESEEINRDEYVRDDLKDLCSYLTTCLGYGNYWLILDEIDKVEEQDKDKFAPLLHIVREKTLKNYRMTDMNEGKGLGIPLSGIFKDGKYTAILEEVNRVLDAGESVLDTRVIAISNESLEIANNSPALFRRFVQIVAEQVMIWRESDLTSDETGIEDCLSNTKREMVSAGIDSGSLTEGLAQGYIEEINLQWQYNFFPKILNDSDMQGNYFRQQAMSVQNNADDKGLDWLRERKYTAFYKVLEDNFLVKGKDFNLAGKLFDCLSGKILTKGTEIGITKKSREEQIKGTRGILIQMEKDLGDHAQVALNIATKLREIYPSRKLKEMDKLNLLTTWTERIISYLDAAIMENPTTVSPLDVSAHLIPALVNVFYTELANDKNMLTDNLVSVTDKFQSFFSEVYQIDPSFNYECDETATQEALYGGEEKALGALDEDEKREVSKYSLYGADSQQGFGGELWIDSASGQLTLAQMEDGLQLAIPIMIKELATSTATGEQETAEKFIENEGAVEFLAKYFGDQLETLHKEFLKSSKDVANKKELRQLFYESAEFVEGLIGSTKES